MWHHFRIKLVFQSPLFGNVRFPKSIIWHFWVLPRLTIFWSIWNDSPSKAVVGVASNVFQWFWALSCFIMFIPSNFCIAFSFTIVTWTSRVILFIGNIWFVIIFYRKWGSYSSSFRCYYNSGTIVSEFIKVLK